MKVLHVIGSINPSLGGPSQVIKDLAPRLSKIGINNDVVCLDEADATYLRNNGFKIHALGPTQTSWFYCARLIPWLQGNLINYDAVIIHGLWLYIGYAVNKVVNKIKQNQLVLSTSVFKVPKIYVMPHGMLDPYFQRSRDRRLKAIRNVIYWSIIESKVINEADGLLFTCEEELKLAKVTFQPYKPRKELIVGLGVVEPPDFVESMREAFQSKCPQIKNEPYLLFLGRIHKKKGVDHLLEAYLKMIINMPRNKLNYDKAKNSKSGLQYGKLPKLVIAGPGIETSFGKELLQFVSKHKELINFVYFPGMLTGDAKWGALYGCEAFILPSHQENFGIAVVEALACSKPVLISNQVNIWREIVNTGGGVATTNDVPGILSQLEFWQKLSLKLKQKMINNAKITYKTHFEIEPRVLKLAELIQADI